MRGEEGGGGGSQTGDGMERKERRMEGVFRNFDLLRG